MAGIVCTNAGIILAELGLGTGASNDSQLEDWFRGLELCFSLVYLTEMLLKLAVMGCALGC